MAKKNNYRIEIKTKKLESIAYNQDYIVIDSTYMINKGYATLDNTLLQDKINNDITFFWNSLNNYINPTAPDLSGIIPVFDSEYTPLTDTNLYTTKGKSQVKIFYNKDKNYLTYMNQDYFNLVNNCDSILKDFRQANKLGNICIFDSDCKLIFLVMPIILRDTFFTENYLFNREVESVLPDMDNLHKYQIA